MRPSLTLTLLWAPARLERSALAGNGFDLRIGAGVADGLSLIRRQPQIGDDRIVRRSGEQLAVGVLTRLAVAAQREIERRGRQDRVGLAIRRYTPPVPTDWTGKPVGRRDKQAPCPCRYSGTG